MIDGKKPEMSVAKTWVMLLGFLAAFLLVLAGVAFFMGKLSGPRDGHGIKINPSSQAGAPH